MPHVLIIGKAFSGIKKYLTANGHMYTLLQDRHATRFPDKKFKNRVVADFSDVESLLAVVDKINSTHSIDATFVTYENYVIPNAIIAKHLGLPGMTFESARACTDKELMRTAFSQAPEKISPDFAVIKSRNQLEKFARSHGFPLIIKPANLSKSLLVTKSNNLEELLKNYDRSLSVIDSIYRRYAPGRIPKLLVEEFLEGHIHSVDAFVDIDGNAHVLKNVVDYQTGYDIGYDDNFHYSRILPSKLPRHEINAIRHAAAVGCSALGMTSSPAHVEIIYTKDGPRIVEIGARNGGYRERMHMLANNIDITRNALALALNTGLDIEPKNNNSVGVFELFPKTAGTFLGISNVDRLQKLPSFSYLSIKAKPEQFVGKAGDGHKMCAVVILTHSDNKVFSKDTEYLRNSVAVITKQ